MFKNFIIKQLIKRKMKGVPEAQQELIIKLVTENPEFFKKIQAQIDHKKKQGLSEQVAMMQVMRENQSELQQILQK